MNGTSRRVFALLLGAALAGDAGAAGIFGDADQDGDVDGDDLIAVQTQFGSVGPTPLLGDADCDGDVDSDDLIAASSTYYGNSPLFQTEATFEFRDPDLDETFDVYFSTSLTGSAGLAFYNIGLRGPETTPIDADSIVWEENVLSTFDASFQAVGFSTPLSDSPMGNDPFAFNALNSQIEVTNAVFGVGQTPVFVEGVDLIPDNPDLVLDVPALLGRITIPGIYELPPEEALALLQPEALLFTFDGVSTSTGTPDSIEVLLTGPPLLGDPDQDGDIDGDDLIAVQESFGAVGPVPLFGDGDGDGDVDGDDLIVVQANFGIVAGVAVPEPSSGIGLSLLLAGVAARRPTRS